MGVSGKIHALKWTAMGAVCAVLVACAGGPDPSSSRNAIVGPALDLLALDFERTDFVPGARVSGRLAREQRDLRLSTPTAGRLRHLATGPIPTEVRVEVTELVTSGNTVRMRGKLALRDLGFGTILAELDDFSASGPMPIAPRGAGPQGLIFRGVEDEVLAWLGGLECDTAARTCGKPRPKPVEAVEEGLVDEDGDIELAALVGPRPNSTLRKLNTGGIRADRVIAAAAPAQEPEPTAELQKIGTTVAALGLLDRSGFWLQTPLVKSESPGVVVLVATGKRLNVTLVPKDGPAGGGSQISLAALTELGADMTDLVTLDVLR